MKPLSIAAIQLNLARKDNYTLLESKAREAVYRFPWLEMLVFSELAVGGAGASNATFFLSEYLDKLKELAKELDVWLIPGSFYEETEEGTFNTTPVIDNKGDLVTKCRKLYPFLPYETGVAAGNEVCVFEIPGSGKVGIHICYDLWFPETSRALALKGAEVILHPSLTDTCDRDVERAMVKATAAQQQCYYIDVNAGGEQGVGLSLIAGPDGEILHDALAGEEFMLVEVDFDRVRRCRKRGLKGLGQPIKSYRDDPKRHLSEVSDTDYLNKLGDLEVAKKEKTP
ncbi:MAG: carbon-nitrogen hydrolase family protein [SAR86 cluster bacterium]|nr:carbon-nitrogen hydrolase family protein [SAR86 cluster bacterium]|tara:strand:+ start:211 stop:1062 length:852 start_codon:yes stop_codon:yes gene_type:complete